MPTELMVNAKNNIMETTLMLANAVLILLESWRTVKHDNLRKYTCGMRCKSAVAKPATLQKNRNVPTIISAVAIQKSPSITTSPFTERRQYAHASTARETANAATRTGAFTFACPSFAWCAERSVASLQRRI